MNDLVYDADEIVRYVQNFYHQVLGEWIGSELGQPIVAQIDLLDVWGACMG